MKRKIPFPTLIDLSQESVHSTIHWLSNRWGWLPFIRMLSFAKLWQEFVLMIERKSSSKRQRHIFCHGLDYGGSCLTFLIELIFILSPKGLRVYCRTWTDCMAGGCPGKRGSQSEELEKSQRRRCGWNKKVQNERFNNDASCSRYQI